MTTTNLDTQAIAAGSGTGSTPVKLTLNTATRKLSLQMKVTVTRATATTPTTQERKCFNLYWAFSPEDLTLATVAESLRGNVRVKTCQLDMTGNVQRFQEFDSCIAGQYCYVWFETPASGDAYSVVIDATEIGS